jgi:hypothetical protein
MHYQDLDLCHYHQGPFEASNWSVPLYTVGWLEHPHTFTRGEASLETKRKVTELVAVAQRQYSHYHFRGIHECSLCTAEGAATPGPIWSQENIFVPGSGAVYVAPGGIVH